MLPVVIIKTKTALALEKFDMSVQEYNINRYDYKTGNNLPG